MHSLSSGWVSGTCFSGHTRKGGLCRRAKGQSTQCHKNSSSSPAFVISTACQTISVPFQSSDGAKWSALTLTHSWPAASPTPFTQTRLALSACPALHTGPSTSTNPCSCQQKRCRAGGGPRTRTGLPRAAGRERTVVQSLSGSGRSSLVRLGTASAPLRGEMSLKSPTGLTLLARKALREETKGTIQNRG